MPDPVLIACSHGTRSASGQEVIEQFRDDLARARPGLRVAEAYVDVQEPSIADVVDGLVSRGTPSVVVPLLLSTGFHVKNDIGRAVAGTGGLARAAGPLGPDPVLVEVLQHRLAESGAGDDDAIVLAATGSSDPEAARAVERMAATLSSARGGVAVVPAYAAAGNPDVAEAVATLRQDHEHVTVAGYLLAPGYFGSKLHRAGADRVTAPLAPHDALVELALRRFDEALG
ncbi:sirohydrochlorin chelatase [Kineosporia succinea]|uniref:Sirohydrochlorin ferrochelatase n=1 Tax=Kineosporia succinea TaxID=84632 RepID=A0ABT9NWK3_9ACTN|nr:CbiX/SirB N-terminal domain-containing protein [Kineosporia succinea]MDP9824802.1 sirohydrochlorin ferrochelatase [Kineosporia succinea]